MIDRPKTPWKTEKTASLVKSLVAEFLVREAGPQSLVTVTDVHLSGDRKRAIIFLSVLPEGMEERALEFVKRQLPDIKKHIMANSRMRAAPFLEFMIDSGEKNRQRIDEILHAEESEKKE